MSSDVLECNYCDSVAESSILQYSAGWSSLADYQRCKYKSWFVFRTCNIRELR